MYGPESDFLSACYSDPDSEKLDVSSNDLAVLD